MIDYLWSFPVEGLALAVEGFAVLQEEIGTYAALGDPRDAEGEVFVFSEDTPIAPWTGRPGSAATSYEDMDARTVEVEAKGDPGRYYVHLRLDQEIPASFDPAAYGLEPSDPYDRAVVLGIWAGDEVPAPPAQQRNTPRIHKPGRAAVGH